MSSLEAGNPTRSCKQGHNFWREWKKRSCSGKHTQPGYYRTCYSMISGPNCEGHMMIDNIWNILSSYIVTTQKKTNNMATDPPCNISPWEHSSVNLLIWLIGALISITAHVSCITCEAARVPDLFVRSSGFQPLRWEQLLSRPVQLGYKLWKQCHGLKEPCLIDEPRREYRAIQGPLTQKHWLSSLLTTTQIHVWLELP